jgi:5-formyltetrahydrofolate cyclo-ligase
MAPTLQEDTPPILDHEKTRLRAEAKRRRAAAALGAPAAGETVRDRVLASVPLPEGAAVSAYWPKGDELDPRPLMRALHARGHIIGLPLVVASGAPLRFRRWAPGDRLEPAGFGLRVPSADKAEVTPGVLFVPLLAFDRAGDRLGYGGGFYDRTLAALRVRGKTLAIGLAYAGQEVPAVPRGKSDMRLDAIVTDGETIWIG